MKNSSTTLSNHLDGPARAEISPLARMFAGAIRTYQSLTAGRVSACRFYPSCSSYAEEAVEVHGAWRGGALALRRIARCRPFGPHGVDLVPHPSRTRSNSR
jgi:putative membrane protein insertion efficiency factor